MDIILITQIINTLVRIIPISLYSGAGISGIVFNDFRGILLFIGLMINEFISYGNITVLDAGHPRQCAIMSNKNSYFTLPSPLVQTLGFFVAFMLTKMYYDGEFKLINIFVLMFIVIVSVWSVVGIECMTFMDAMFSLTLGMMLGTFYMMIVKKYYKPQYLDINSNDDDTNTNDIIFE